MIVVQDFETTGLLVNGRDWSFQPGIVQIGAIKLDDDLNEVGRFQTLINPEMAEAAWSKEAMETTGITPKHVADAPTFFGCFYEYADFMRGAKYWCGWNAAFDLKVLKHQLDRYGYEMNFPWPSYHIDAMKTAGRVLEMKGKKGTKFPKLEEAYELILKKKLVDAHDAMADVLATAEIIRHADVRPWLGVER